MSEILSVVNAFLDSKYFPFLVGLFIGGLVGVFCMGLAQAARDFWDGE